MKFIPDVQEVKTEKAYFAGGCFWGVEYYFQQEKGVKSTHVGYMGGEKEHPTYEEICSGSTDHIETMEVMFDPEETNFETLARLFFEIHDPTQINQQGPDIGEQYKSVIFYVDEKQKQISGKLITSLKANGIKVVTEIIKANKFWIAEAYHQQYYQKNGKRPYCHLRIKRFSE